MTTGWTRVCADCGNIDGAKVERIAFHPTFRCECGYEWDGSRATFVGVWKVEVTATKGRSLGRPDRGEDADRRTRGKLTAG